MNISHRIMDNGFLNVANDNKAIYKRMPACGCTIGHVPLVVINKITNYVHRFHIPITKGGALLTCYVKKLNVKLSRKKTCYFLV